MNNDTLVDVIPLFSKPVFRTVLSFKDIDFSDINWLPNYQNWISSTQNILDDPKFLDLRNQILDQINFYFYSVLCADKSVEVYITESWLNKTDPQQSHHRHWHPNSIFSGVFYFTSSNDSGRIKFLTSNYDMLEYNVTDANIFNSKSWSLPVERGSLVIFPSNLEHLVTTYTGNTPRISLAFNTFLRGTVNRDPLTKLVI